MHTTNLGPHHALNSKNASERFVLNLFDRLWEKFRSRVSYVNNYETLIQESGASFFNDHIALRTFCSQNPLAGISSISRIFEALGYRAADCYNFEDKHLNAIYFQHPQPNFPKVFISELRTWELKPSSKHIIHAALKTHRTNLPESFLADLHHLETKSESSRESLLDEAVEFFLELPWHLPEKSDLLELNLDSQYAAWVLVHGYNVNHFTSLINSHKVPALDDIEKTSKALLDSGVPMKKEIEGAKGSKLRQTATEAVVIDVPVLENGKSTTMPWTYAYFELAQRDTFKDLGTGKLLRYEGFLGPQATNLFDMTKIAT
ncbi:MAG: hypothetical protein RL553_836 [Planctomycetota bacterium]|jgi:hypothetical protein